MRRDGDNVGEYLIPISLCLYHDYFGSYGDSFVVFQPEQITTSNETVQSIFGVESLIGNIAPPSGSGAGCWSGQIKDRFAHYKAGYFEDIYAESYTTKLRYDRYFTFEQGGLKWNEVVPLKLYMTRINRFYREATVYYPSFTVYCGI